MTYCLDRLAEAGTPYIRQADQTASMQVQGRPPENQTMNGCVGLSVFHPAVACSQMFDPDPWGMAAGVTGFSSNSPVTLQ